MTNRADTGYLVFRIGLRGWPRDQVRGQMKRYRHDDVNLLRHLPPTYKNRLRLGVSKPSQTPVVPSGRSPLRFLSPFFTTSPLLPLVTTTTLHAWRTHLIQINTFIHNLLASLAALLSAWCTPLSLPTSSKPIINRISFLKTVFHE